MKKDRFALALAALCFFLGAVRGFSQIAVPKELEDLVVTDQNRAMIFPVQWPTEGNITRGFGPALDLFSGRPFFNVYVSIAAPTGTPVVSMMAGKIARAENDPARDKIRGKFVEVESPSGFRVRYNNLSEVLAAAGALVRAGDIVGKVGNTGYSTGSCLFFDMSYANLFLDPVYFYKIGPASRGPFVGILAAAKDRVALLEGDGYYDLDGKLLAKKWKDPNEK